MAIMPSIRWGHVWRNEGFGVWRIQCLAQIEHKRISVYAQSANQSVYQKGYPLAQAHCTAFAQTAGLFVWFAPASAQATMAACDAHGRCADCVGSTTVFSWHFQEMAMMEHKRLL